MSTENIDILNKELKMTNKTKQLSFAAAIVFSGLAIAAPEEQKMVSFANYAPAESESLVIEEGIGITPYIIGGAKASPLENNFHARLVVTDGYSFSGYCGGTAITDTFILTAAHCIEEDGQSINNIEDMGILINNPTQNVYKEEMKKVKKVYVHESYEDALTTGYDIALIELESPITDNINTISLPSSPYQETVENKGQLFAIGMGYINDFREVPEHLQIGEMKYHSCDGIGSIPSIGLSIDEDTLFCSVYKGGVGDSSIGDGGVCNGDSGGSIYERKDGSVIQYGVTSFGNTRCETDGVDVFTNVYEYDSWISNIVMGNELIYDPSAGDNGFHGRGDNYFVYDGKDVDVGGSSGGSTGLLSIFGLMILAVRRKFK